MRTSFYDEGTFMDARGTKIFYRVWRARRTRSIVALFHALGLHSGRYAWFCEELASRSVSCYAVDLFGYGLSEGPRGGSLRGLLDSGEKFLQLVVAKWRIPGLIVVGHGSGVLVARHAAKSLGVKAHTLAIEPFHEIAAHLHMAARLRVLSLLNLRVRINPQPLYDIDHDDARLEAEEDNLIVRRVPAKLVYQLIELAKHVDATDGCLTVLEADEDRADDAVSKLYPCRRKFYFDPRTSRFPFDEVLELLMEAGGPPNR